MRYIRVCTSEYVSRAAGVVVWVCERVGACWRVLQYLFNLSRFQPSLLSVCVTATTVTCIM